jgi:hypothetical protein
MHENCDAYDGKGFIVRTFFARTRVCRYCSRVEPSAFRARRLLESINNLAVGASLAAATSFVSYGVLFVFGYYHPEYIAWITGVPTLMFGVLWATLLRRPQTFRDSKLRVAWLLSAPLAMANAGVVAGLLFTLETYTYLDHTGAVTRVNNE